MSQYKLSFVDDSVIALLESVEQYYQYVKEKKKHDLPIPTCIFNEHCLTMNVLEKKWLSDFLTLYHVCNELEKDNYISQYRLRNIITYITICYVHVRDYKKKLKFASLFVFYLTLILRTICLGGKKMLPFFLRNTC